MFCFSTSKKAWGHWNNKSPSNSLHLSKLAKYKSEKRPGRAAGSGVLGGDPINNDGGTVTCSRCSAFSRAAWKHYAVPLHKTWNSTDPVRLLFRTGLPIVHSMLRQDERMLVAVSLALLNQKTIFMFPNCARPIWQSAQTSKYQWPRQLKYTALKRFGLTDEITPAKV